MLKLRYLKLRYFELILNLLKILESFNIYDLNNFCYREAGLAGNGPTSYGYVEQVKLGLLLSHKPL